MVYVGGDTTLKRYLAGRVAEAPTGLPEAVAHPVQIRSYSDGNVILTLDQKTGRVGSFRFDGTRLSFSRQFEVKSASHLTSFVYDQKANIFYGVIGKKLVKFSAKS
jgi:hypothetical protein